MTTTSRLLSLRLLAIRPLAVLLFLVGLPACDDDDDQRRDLAGVDMAMPDLAPFGAPCESNAECKSGACVPPAGRCSKSCTAAADCPGAPEWSCENVTGVSDKICVCAPSGPELCDGKDNDCDTEIDDSAICPAGQTCKSGKCECASENMCGGTCVDRQIDANNCGACGKACATGESCQAGKCVCPMANLCGGACADLMRDENNCGKCGMKCAAGLSCLGGQCGCLPGEALCGGACINVTGDANNCGGCGRTCKGGACTGGQCPLVTLAGAQPYPYDLAVDNTGIYWTTHTAGGRVTRANLDGMMRTTLVQNLAFPAGIAVAAGTLYYTTAFNGTVARVTTAGMSPTTMVTGQATPRGIIAVGNNIYWIVRGDDAIRYVQNDGGGNPLTLVSGQSGLEDLASDGNFIYFTNSIGPVVMMKQQGGSVRKVSLDGMKTLTDVVKSAEGSGAPAGVAVHDNVVYFTNSSLGTVNRVNPDGMAMSVLASGQQSPTGIAVDATGVYFTNQVDGTVKRVGLDGKNLTTLAAGQNGPTNIVLDNDSVYWVTFAGGNVMKTNK